MNNDKLTKEKEFYMKETLIDVCKYEDDKCKNWYMGLCDLDDRLEVCPHSKLYKQLQEQKPVKKLYRIVNVSFGKYRVCLYHNGKLFLEKEMWRTEGLDDYIEEIEEQGYTLGFTKKEVEEARNKYKYYLANMVEE